jgi:hypothetical protein
MTKINDLNTIDTLADGNLLVVWNGSTRAITAADAAAYFAPQSTSGPFQPLDELLTALSNGTDRIALEVADYAELKALTADQINNFSMFLMRGTRGGIFEKKTGSSATVSALFASDPGEGIFVSLTNGGTTIYAERMHRAASLEAAWWGVVADATVVAGVVAGTDNTVALNHATAYLRRQLVTVTIEGTGSLSLPPGFVLVTSANFTGLRGAGWAIHGNGCGICSKTPGKAVVDLLHSRNGTISNLVAIGDINTPPRRGFQTGYLGTAAVSASNLQFHNCPTVGFFTEFAEYNGGSEETTVWGSQRENGESTCIASIGLDAQNEYGRFSDYQTGNLVAKVVTGVTKANPGVVTCAGHGYANGQKVKFGDITSMTELNGNVYEVANATTDTFELSATDTTGFTTFTAGGFVWRTAGYSMVNIRYSNASGFSLNGGNGMVVVGGVNNLDFWGYLYSLDKAGMLVFLRTGVDARRPADLNLNAVIEGANLQSCVEIQRNTGDAAFTGWNINLNGIQPDDQVFLDDNTTGTVTLLGARIEVDTISTTPTNGLFFPAAKWRGQGQMFLRPFSGLSNLPGLWIGEIAVQDPDAWAWPAGSYEVQSITVAAAIQDKRYVKGETRFISAAASTIAAGDFDTLPYTSMVGTAVTAVNSTSQTVMNGDGLVTPGVRTAIFVLADEAATSFPLPATNLGAGALIAVESSSQSAANSIVWVRGSGTPAITALTALDANTEVTTGPLTGTTGNNTKFTISVADDGRVYLENQIGTSLTGSVTVIAAIL